MSDTQNYREFELYGLQPSEWQWALDNDAVHGIGYALEDPVAVRDTTDDADDHRKTYVILADPEDAANAVVEINQWITELPDRNSPEEFDAHGFVSALSRVALAQEVDG
ncbi:hypothetical protein AWC29_00040 [Mycobacterium triplex]|uniref:Uncharacterized protein n=1 Tax=Mycobacterium triplex TaxID=47839 RepID=A0A024K297_9MYCO|nr:hypothetical protein [Mycobacterium triplex]ORX05915.1 hypothetical protein AWC29_00040 [Mycobacterium triplex]CDO89954.1 hypothetical protein BN973_04345 [Mycobacterium triplex]